MEPIRKILLSPFTFLYWLVITTRNKFFDLGILPSVEFDLPVICVGNISVGGTGKTPHVEFLIENLKDEFRIAVLSRGYKRQSKGFILSGENPDPILIGDEPCQMKKKYPEIIVAVDEKRSRGIQNLLELNSPPDVILLDDAFQHRFVKAGMNIVLMDFNKPASKDCLLPGGRLREPLESKKRAQILLITKSPARLKAIDMRLIANEMKMHEFQHLYFTSIQQNNPEPVFNGIYPDTSMLKNKDIEILLISGIANPRQLKPFARKFSTRIKEIQFPDHYNYSSSDAEKIIAEFNQLGKYAILLTTEKDAVKLQELPKEFEEIKDKMFYLPIHIEFLNEDRENFLTQIYSYVRDNKRDSILHKGKN